MFPLSSVVTNLVTSLEFKAICCATMLCHFGRTRNGYVATRFILLNSTVESSVTSGYVIVPERSGHSEAWAGRNVERTGKKFSLVPNSGFNRCSMEPHVNMKFSNSYMNFILCISFILWCIFINFLWWKTSLTFCLYYYCIGAGITTLTSISDGLDPYFFSWKMEKTRSMKEKTNREVYIYRQSRHFSFISDMNKTFLYLYLDLACKQLCFPPRKKYK